MKFKIVLSENEEVVSNIRAGLKANDGYCPCAMENTPDTKCMCKEFRDKDTEGLCHCGLYRKVLA